MLVHWLTGPGLKHRSTKYLERRIGIETYKEDSDHNELPVRRVRPYGTALLIAGVNDTRPRLFESDPSGALLEYKATAIGAGRNTFMEVFEAEYREDLNIDEAILLGMTALYRSTEGKLDAATLEVGVVTLQDRMFRKLVEEEVQQYVLNP